MSTAETFALLEAAQSGEKPASVYCRRIPA